jgi:hypothetical protein
MARQAVCCQWNLGLPFLAIATSYDQGRREARGMLHWPHERWVTGSSTGMGWRWFLETTGFGMSKRRPAAFEEGNSYAMEKV